MIATPTPISPRWLREAWWQAQRLRVGPKACAPACYRPPRRMPRARDRFCHACGAAFADAGRYPRTCAAPGCGTMVWANPLPVAVTLVPIADDGRTGLLVVRRGLEPQLGKLCLVGGFIEEHESWQAGAAREVGEETGLVIDPATVALFDAWSTEPRPTMILLFATVPPVPAASLPPFVPSPESTHRGVVFGPAGLDEVIGFPLHLRAARRWFGERGITGGHQFSER
jgi:ADP-ribose pyrophosphatase YjhB (NUDIX family)